MRVYFVGLANPPEEFLRRKYDALRRAGVDVLIARDFFETLPVPRPDVVHFEWNGGAIDFLGRDELWELPTLVSCRGTQIRVRPHISTGYADQLRETFRRATLVHCVCETVREEACALGLDREKAVVILPAVDVDEFRPRPARGRTASLRLLAGPLAGVVGWVLVREWLVRRAGARGVSRSRWSLCRSPVALPGPPRGHRRAAARRWRR